MTYCDTCCHQFSDICGGKAEVHDLGGWGYFVKCRKCSINQDKLYKQRCYAVKAWNKRVEDRRKQECNE